MKILVTHQFPHFDDIAGFWLFQRFVPGWKKAKYEFMKLQGQHIFTYKMKPVDSNANVIHIGVGRGKYDEHKGDIGKCAALLVYEDLLRRRRIPKQLKPALDRFLEVILLEDTGRLMELPYRPFYLAAALRAIPESLERTELGLRMMDAVFKYIQDEMQAEEDVNNGIEIATRYGPAIVVKSISPWTTSVATRCGYVIVGYVNPKMQWRGVVAKAGTSIDLSRLNEAVRQLEPKADWFFHHSKQMLLCGSASATKVKTSKFSPDKLARLIENTLSH